MIWALLALLGIPIWFIAVVLIAVFRNRKAVRSNLDVFEFRRSKGDGWQRGMNYARWVSDVLIVHVGLALIRTDAAKVESIVLLGEIETAPKGLGEDPSEVLITFEGGATETFGVAAENLNAMMGTHGG
jgi:hypothetical protein